MRIALVDDSEIERGILLSLLADFACDNHISFESDCFESGDAFLSSFSSDIFMSGMSGVETAQKIRETDSRVILIFLTSSADFMPDAFSVHAFHYILKPYQKDAIFTCLTDAFLHLPAPETIISFSVNAIELHIPASQIVCIMADSHYTWIMDQNGQTYHPCSSFGAFSKQLANDNHFLLVSRGVLCNMDDIEAFTADGCLLSNGKTVPVTMRNARRLEQTWRDYCFTKTRDVSSSK